MTLTQITNSGIRSPQSVTDIVKKVVIDLRYGDNSLGSKSITISSSRINTITTTELIRNAELLFDDIIRGRYVPYMLYKRNSSGVTTQISDDSELRDAILSGDAIVLEMYTSEYHIQNKAYYSNSLNAIGSNRIPEELLEIGGWITPDTGTSWRRGLFGSAVVRDNYFRSIQSSYAAIVGDDSSPKKYSVVNHTDNSQSVKFTDLEDASAFGGLTFSSWALYAIYDRFGCNTDDLIYAISSGRIPRVGSDCVVILPPPLLWDPGSSPGFVANGKHYTPAIDTSSYLNPFNQTSQPTTLGWIADGCKNFLELTHIANDIRIPGTTDISDLGLMEFGIEVIKDIDNGVNVNYIYPDYVSCDDNAISSPQPGGSSSVVMPIQSSADDTEFRYEWSGSTLYVYHNDEQQTITFDPTVKWFGVTAAGKSTHDTYGNGASYGRTNAAMTKSRFISLFSLPANTTDDIICDLFSNACDLYPVRISPAGFIVLPPGFFWMNVTTNTSASNVSFKDDIGRIWKFITTEWSDYPVLTDMTFVKAETAVSNQVFSNTPLDDFSGVVTDLSTWNDFGCWWDYIPGANTNFCISRVGDAVKWEYSSYSSTSPTAVVIEQEDVTVRLVWNTTLKCFVDTRMSVSTNKTVKYGIDANDNLCAVHENNIGSLPPGMILVTKYTRAEGSSMDPTVDRNTCYMIPPVGWSWVNTTAGNYNVVDPRGITWTYGGTSGDDQHYWVASACKIYGTKNSDFRDYVFDNPSTTTVQAYSPGYAGTRSTWPSTVQFSLDCGTLYVDVSEPDPWPYYRGDYTSSGSKTYTKSNSNTLYITPNSDWMVLAYMIPINW